MPDPVASSADSELRAHVERVLTAHYELDAEIGRGGMGIVYRARDRRLKRQIAIKILPPELAFRSEIRSRFLREAETAASLNHPNIVDIYTVDELEGLVFFVMAYISGDNLAKRLHERGVLDVDETRRIVREVADALAYAHERGVVHRDIKPDNIILDAESGRSMVTDFGIARAITEGGDSRLTATGMALGTPAYMSPEQAAGERQIDGRSDLYSLGIVAYQMLCGEPPFTATSTPAMLVKHISERPTPIEQRRTEVPQDLARAVMMLLEKDPANRFPSASALVAALDTGYVPTIQGRGTRSEGRDLQASTPTARPAPRTGQAVDPFGGPTVEEQSRWEAPMVQQFRRKLAPYLFVNAVIVVASIFGDRDFFGITVLWSIYIAYKYAKLWTEGYDWRDVFRQPRDRELIDVADDVVEHSRALFDRNKRLELRKQRRSQQLARRALPGP
ncbi:MAG: serine/threonine protein kinase, partial [Gemmatimonadota bacterium]|nr:serine/threonine protein kinase [Gemmatimonadota bacterium]